MSSDFKLGALDKHAELKGEDTKAPPKRGHTADLPLSVVENDLTATVTSRKRGDYVNGRPVASYQVAIRLGERTPSEYKFDHDQAEYIARTLEFAADRVRFEYGVPLRDQDHLREMPQR